MKKQIIAALALALCTCQLPAQAAEQEKAVKEAAVQSKPACVVLNFSDETACKDMNLAPRLSNHVLAELSKSKLVRLKQEQPLAKDMEKELNQVHARDIAAAKSAMQNGDLSAVFESPYFASERSAETVGTAKVGQVVSPEVTRTIGETSQAEYLLQGAILGVGAGVSENKDLKAVQDVSRDVFFNSTDGTNPVTMVAGAVAALSGLFHHKEAKLSMIADLKVIKADTGEVVWRDQATTTAKKTEFSALFVGHGSADNLSGDMQSGLLKKAAHNLVEKLSKAVAAGEVFK